MLFSFPTSFLAWVFVRAVGCSGCTPQVRGCAAAACVLAYKNHDKKVEGTRAKQPAFRAACRAFAAWSPLNPPKGDFNQTDDALPINRLSCRFLVRHIFRCCQYIYALPCIALVVYCIALANIKLHWLVCVGHFL
jgi:hypothetical protein